MGLHMTPEEAAEIILGGEQWVPCQACKQRDDDCEDLFVGGKCPVCEDSHAELSPDYRKACEVLRRPPPPIWRESLRDGMIHKTGPSVFMGKFPIKPRRYIIYKSEKDGKNEKGKKTTKLP